MWNKLLTTLVEKRDLFPFVPLYLKNHGWVYTGYGRWTRRDALLWSKSINDGATIELWDVGLNPRRLQRRILDNTRGLMLLFSD